MPHMGYKNWTKSYQCLWGSKLNHVLWHMFIGGDTSYADQRYAGLHKNTFLLYLVSCAVGLWYHYRRKYFIVFGHKSVLYI